MKCTECNNEMRTVRELYHYTESGLDNIYLAGIDILKCDTCGNSEAKIPKIEMLHMVIAECIISQPQPLNDKEIKYLRKYIGIKANYLAKLMDVAKATVSRWENGTQPMGKIADKLLRLLVIRFIEEQEIKLFPGRIIPALEKIDSKATTKKENRIQFDPVSATYSWCYS